MSITHPSFGTLDDDRIIIFDTTLRDGEQSPGCSMNLDEKIRMAEALTELGVDVLEAGFRDRLRRAISKASRRSPKAVGQRDDTPVIASLAGRLAGRIAGGRMLCGRQSAGAFISSSPRGRPAHEVQVPDGT